MHTPGPWTYRKAYGNGYIIENEASILAETPFDNTEANARLIAAAPKLLEGHRNILTLLQDKDWNSLTNAEATILGVAEAAIAKATGG